MKAYIHRNGRTFGPYLYKSLRYFIKSGHAYPSDLVFAISQGEWVRLGDFLRIHGDDPCANPLLENSLSQQIHAQVDNTSKTPVLCELGSKRVELLFLLTVLPRMLLRSFRAPSTGFVSVIKAKSALLPLLNSHCGYESQLKSLKEQEVLKYAEKIKTLVQSKEIELAIDLLRSLNEAKLYSELLKGCSIEQEGENQGNPRLPDWFWNKDEENFELPFFLLLLHHCRHDDEIHFSLRKENLTSLVLKNSAVLKNIDSLCRLKNLVSLDLSACLNLKNVAGLSRLTNLTTLNLAACVSLVDLDALCDLTSLTDLNLNCVFISNLADLGALTNLRFLNLYSCSSLTEDQVADLRKALPDCEIIF